MVEGGLGGLGGLAIVVSFFWPVHRDIPAGNILRSADRFCRAWGGEGKGEEKGEGSERREEWKAWMEAFSSAGLRCGGQQRDFLSVLVRHSLDGGIRATLACNLTFAGTLAIFSCGTFTKINFVIC